jgi:ring-1,2-phenylacetyl-CoA epoxidase subunit PaaC
MVLSHRNSEWCGHAPILEQDIALTNIALDQIGQARNFYQYAASILQDQTDETISEDTLAYLRDGGDFKNVLLAELPNGDWAKTILRNFFICTYQYFLYQELGKTIEEESGNTHKEQLKAICNKALKEVSYHVRWTADWVIRLGDGTEESHVRMRNAIEELWPYTGELLKPIAYEIPFLNGKETNIQVAWEHKISAVLEEAKLTIPTSDWMQSGGKKGIHTEHLGFILAEMQFIQRAYPGLEW